MPNNQNEGRAECPMAPSDNVFGKRVIAFINYSKDHPSLRSGGS